ncbi:MAG: hypothetical protein L0Z50_17420 [Verrucomicrobiales bacterium]|nr:hypothetical protein [Verrucomicrobiales bacterium]
MGSVLERLQSQQVADITTVADADDTAEIANELDEAAALDDEADKPAEETGPLIDQVKLKAEIAELESYLTLARSIGSNAKGEKLIARLPEVLDEIEKRGGKRKAVIFTESVRTQKYLAGLLTANGYAGQIVLLNGSNSDPESQALYRAWYATHKDTDIVSGSKSADMKAAVVDAFRGDDKTILIATESGAEGINLQFCSLLVNFDLPWNPQRVEQRIGRCHRYGQKIDVTVVNMLNLRNKAEKRVHDLLDQKFRLFSGVFGASDSVLGVIESGIDFERKVVEAVQRGRTDAEVEQEFEKIEEQLSEKIAADMQDARRKLFDAMDRDVVARLRGRGDEINHILDAFTTRLITLARAELPNARFHDATGPRFDWQGQTFTTEWPYADEQGWQFFRLADGTLARELVDAAKARPACSTALRFDYAARRATGRPKLSNVERLIGRSGWLRVSLLSVNPADPQIGQRQRLLVSGLADDGLESVLFDAATADDLFLVPAAVVQSLPPEPTDPLAALDAEGRQERLKEIEAENHLWLDQETSKLDDYADDLEKAADIRAKELDTEIKAAKRALRGNNSITLEDRIKENRRIATLQNESDELKLTTFQRKKAIRQEVDTKLDNLANALKTTPEVTPVLTVRWEVIQ